MKTVSMILVATILLAGSSLAEGASDRDNLEKVLQQNGVVEVNLAAPLDLSAMIKKARIACACSGAGGFVVRFTSPDDQTLIGVLCIVPSFNALGQATGASNSCGDFVPVAK